MTADPQSIFLRRPRVSFIIPDLLLPAMGSFLRYDYNAPRSKLRNHPVTRGDWGIHQGHKCKFGWRSTLREAKTFFFPTVPREKEGTILMMLSATAGPFCDRSECCCQENPLSDSSVSQTAGAFGDCLFSWTANPIEIRQYLCS